MRSSAFSRGFATFQQGCHQQQQKWQCQLTKRGGECFFASFQTHRVGRRHPTLY